MKKNIPIYCLLLISIILVAPICAQQAQNEPAAETPLQKIVLKDGTVLKGNVIGFENNAYIVETRHIGKIKINAVNLKSITELSKQPAPQIEEAAPEINNPANNVIDVSQNAAGLNQNPVSGAGQNLNMGAINQIQKDLMKDPEINNAMQEMLKDPELLKLMMNKDLMSAALSMDPQKIQSNPHVQELLKNPKMQALMEKIRGKMASP